jgi:hypothetical protein
MDFLQAYHQFFVLDYFQEFQLLVFCLVLQKDLVKTLAGFLDEVLQFKFSVGVYLLLFETHDFVVCLQRFFGDFDKKVNGHYFQIVHFGVEKVQTFAHFQQLNDVNHVLCFWVLFYGVAGATGFFALNSMDHDDSVEDLPPFEVLAGFRFFHFLFFHKDVGEVSENIFGFLEIFAEVIWH